MKSSSNNHATKRSQHVITETHALAPSADVRYLIELYDVINETATVAFKARKIDTSIDTNLIDLDSDRPSYARKYCYLCAIEGTSPIYSDRLFYAKQPLRIKEILPVSEKTTFTHPDDDDFIPIYKSSRNGASGTFHNDGSIVQPNDFQFSFESNALLLASNSNQQNYSSRTENYNFPESKVYNEFSEKVVDIEMNTAIVSPTKHKNATMKVPILEQNPAVEQVENLNNRTSMLMLEPLFIAISGTKPKLIKNPSYYNTKMSERKKLIKILTAYCFTIIFVISIAFYLVYPA
ncbi:hypothetical protein TKK_0014011 [Trichogramma kaykai]